MSNVMSIKNIKNNVHRNAFDLSNRNAFTAKVGELLPVYTKEVIPGDKFKLRVESFSRTQPVNTAAFTRIKEYYDWFFVPNRLLWRYFDSFITQMGKTNPQYPNDIDSAETNASFPPLMLHSDILKYLDALINKSVKKDSDTNNCSYNMFGYWRAPLTIKLLQYLGYGDFPLIKKSNYDQLDYNQEFPYQATDKEKTTNVLLSPFPLFAYQKIYQDYYRDSQWQNSSPQTCNCDYMTFSSKSFVLPIKTLIDHITSADGKSTDMNMFDLQYCNWNKDMFMGVLPNSQFGDVATVDVGSVSSHLSNDLFSGPHTVPYGSFQGTNSHDFDVNTGSINYFQSGQIKSVILNNFNSDISQNLEKYLSVSSSFSVLALRQAEALQKWKEITQSTKQDYKHQIESHFGVSVPDVRSNLCTWLGGTSSSITINEVVNNNLADINSNDSNQAFIAGKGIGMINSSEEFEAKEHGILMCIYHAVPLLDYDLSGYDPLVLKNSLDKYAIPELDSIGNEPLPRLWFTNSSKYNSDPNNSTLGFVPRYVDYKTSVDVVRGAFKESLKYWVAPMSESYLPFLYSAGFPPSSLTWTFFKVNPSIMDTIFAVNSNSDINTDNLLVNAFFDVKAVRNLDYNGLPY